MSRLLTFVAGDVSVPDMSARLTIRSASCTTSQVADFYGEFGSRVRQAREAQRLSQAELARRIELSRTSVTNIERGTQRVPLHYLITIADALGVTPMTLLPESPNCTAIEKIMPLRWERDLPDDLEGWVRRVVTRSDLAPGDEQ